MSDVAVVIASQLPAMILVHLQNLQTSTTHDCVLGLASQSYMLYRNSHNLSALEEVVRQSESRLGVLRCNCNSLSNTFKQQLLA